MKKYKYVEQDRDFNDSPVLHFIFEFRKKITKERQING